MYSGQSCLDATGREVVSTQKSDITLAPKQEEVKLLQSVKMNDIHLWNLEQPYLYTLYTDVYIGEKLVDTYSTNFGIRKIEFDPQKGFMLNGCPVKLKGTNLHQDHAGVGTGIPDRLWEYRIKKMKTIGSNAIRTSHNPMSPVFLDLCDRLGMLVIEENRLMGINREHIGLLEHMIKRDRNHPCIILWSIGNEEWALEGNERGLRITKSMTEYVHQLDSTRLSTQGTAGGRVSLFGVDVKGYNYLRQNPIDEFHQKHPECIRRLVRRKHQDVVHVTFIIPIHYVVGWLPSIVRLKMIIILLIQWQEAGSSIMTVLGWPDFSIGQDLIIEVNRIRCFIRLQAHSLAYLIIADSLKMKPFI